MKHLKNWIMRLPIWRKDTQNINTKLVYAVLFIVALLSVGAVWQKAQAQQLEHGQSHGWQSEFAASSASPKLKWDAPVEVRFHGDEDISKELEYAIWSWSQRTGHDISYGGKSPSVSNGASMTITVQLISPLEMQAKSNNFNTKGLTDFWYYSATGTMIGAVVNLNDLYFPRNKATGKVKIDQCALQTIVHEIGHAIGSRHTSSSDDVMSPYGATGCRYSLSPNDITAAAYDGSQCFVELTMENDLYIPDIHGKRVSLKKLEGNIWRIENLADNPESLCGTAQVDEQLNLTITDIRGEQAQLWARFKFIGNDQWELQYAQ